MARSLAGTTYDQICGEKEDVMYSFRKQFVALCNMLSRRVDQSATIQGFNLKSTRPVIEIITLPYHTQKLSHDSFSRHVNVNYFE